MARLRHAEALGREQGIVPREDRPPLALRDVAQGEQRRCRSTPTAISPTPVQVSPLAGDADRGVGGGEGARVIDLGVPTFHLQLARLPGDNVITAGLSRAMRQAMERIAEGFRVPVELLTANHTRAFAAVFNRMGPAGADGILRRAARVAVRGDEESALPADTVATLVDLARANAEADFRDLAVMSGVAPEQVDELWKGTRSRGR
jgi:hypothetical protein